jgi:8-oxo-dGTP diphosphatase
LKEKYDSYPMEKVLAAVIEKDGLFLIAQRKKGDRFEGLWEFPGGKLEPGETPEEGLKRELAEEFGIEARVEDFLCSVRYRSPSYALELRAYKVSHIGRQFRLYDHDDIRWVSLEDIKRYPLVEPDLAIVRKLEKLRPPQK